MGQLADSLREIIQTMKDGDEILRQNIKEIEKSAEALVNAADDLVETIED
jgi:methyl-accepting chemotaxis protein